ncbi:MAG: RIP metalloprotease RseP [Spirochaetaceae bacterium]|nr:RIP metalloprotease RseP [Spirochaetaceae bacterium]
MTIILGIIALSVIIIFHEFGHFIAAKLCKIEVDAFSLGMGPVLLHKKIRGTDFRLSLVPLGGYCALKGENAFQNAIDADLSEIPKEKGTFYENPLKRILIAFSGPFANVVFSVIAYFFIALIGYSYQTTGTKIILANEIYPEISSAAEQAGLRTGDEITAINGKTVDNFQEMYTIIATNPNKQMDFEVLRNNQTYHFLLTPQLEKSTGAGKIGVLSWTDPVIAEIPPDSDAAKAGLKLNDIIKKADNIEITNTADFMKAIENKRNVALTVERNGNLIELNLPINYNQDNGGYITGISFPYKTVEVKANSIFSALTSGFKETGENIAVTIKTLKLLFSGIDLTNAVSGPVRITLMLGDTAKAGFSAGLAEGIVSVLSFLAIISISLFIMNLLPLPILDGGLILFAFIEFVRGKGLKPKTIYQFQKIGIVLIALLFIFAFSGDLRYLFFNGR